MRQCCCWEVGWELLSVLGALPLVNLRLGLERRLTLLAGFLPTVHCSNGGVQFLLISDMIFCLHNFAFCQVATISRLTILLACDLNLGFGGSILRKSISPKFTESTENFRCSNISKRCFATFALQLLSSPQSIAEGPLGVTVTEIKRKSTKQALFNWYLYLLAKGIAEIWWKIIAQVFPTVVEGSDLMDGFKALPDLLKTCVLARGPKRHWMMSRTQLRALSYDFSSWSSDTVSILVVCDVGYLWMVCLVALYGFSQILRLSAGVGTVFTMRNVTTVVFATVMSPLMFFTAECDPCSVSWSGFSRGRQYLSATWMHLVSFRHESLNYHCR